MLVYDDAVCGCGAPTMCGPNETFASTPLFTDKHPLNKIFDDGNDSPLNFWTPRKYINGDPNDHWWVPVSTVFATEPLPSRSDYTFAGDVRENIRTSIAHLEELHEKNIVVAFPTANHSGSNSLSADHAYMRTDRPAQANIMYDMAELSGGGKREYWASAGPYRWTVPTVEPININDSLAVCPATGGRLVSVLGHGAGQYTWWEVHNPNGWMPLNAVPYYSVGHHPNFVDSLLTALSVRYGENLRYAPYSTNMDYMNVCEVDFYVNDEHPNVPMTVLMISNSVKVENRAGKRIPVFAIQGYEVADVARLMALVETDLTDQEWFDVYEKAVQYDARDSYANKHALTNFVAESNGCPSKLRTIHAVTVNR